MLACMFVRPCLFMSVGGVSLEVMGPQLKSRVNFSSCDTFSLTGCIDLTASRHWLLWNVAAGTCT